VKYAFIYVLITLFVTHKDMRYVSYCGAECMLEYIITTSVSECMLINEYQSKPSSFRVSLNLRLCL